MQVSEDNFRETLTLYTMDTSCTNSTLPLKRMLDDACKRHNKEPR